MTPDITGTMTDMSAVADASVDAIFSIVESHECLIPGMTRQLIERFAPTHAITVVEDNGQRQIPDAPAWFNNLAHLDQLLATWGGGRVSQSIALRCRSRPGMQARPWAGAQGQRHGW